MTDTTTLPITGPELMALRDELHGNAVARGWWSDPATGKRIERDFLAMQQLENTEITEAHEGWQHDHMDDKLPHRKMLEVELADYVIRALDRSGGFNIDVGNEWEDVFRDTADVWSGLLAEDTESVFVELFNISSHTTEAYRKSDAYRVETNTQSGIALALVFGQLLALDVLGAIREKAEFNKVRKDHDLAERLKDGGKKV